MAANSSGGEGGGEWVAVPISSGRQCSSRGVGVGQDISIG